MALRDILAPFRARNFRLFWFGQAVSLTGSWCTQTAVNWVVHVITGSLVMQGWFTFLQQIPNFLLAPFAGVVADRVDRMRFLLVAQVAGLLTSCALSAYAWFDGASVRTLALLCLARGLVSAIEVPARQVMIVRFIGDASLLARAIALNSSLFNLARFVGPALAGWIYQNGESLPGPARAGAFVCFALDALSFIPVIGALLAMRLPPEPARTAPRQHPLRELAAGVRYARANPTCRLLIPSAAALSLFGLSYAVMLPRLASEVYKGNAATYGALLSAVAVGSLIAALALAARRDTVGLERHIALGGACLGAGLAGMAFLPPLHVSWFFLALAGYGGVSAMASTNTLLQYTVDEAFRGRVVGLFHMSFSGMLPFGGLLAGYLAGHFGARVGLGFAAGASALIALRVARGAARAARVS